MGSVEPLVCTPTAGNIMQWLPEACVAGTPAEKFKKFSKRRNLYAEFKNDGILYIFGYQQTARASFIKC